ncbi:E2F transcription factor 3 [Mortierella sp. AM989]|nr:E2F transcription factor 3 [Mortierella sp. AM989]
MSAMPAMPFSDHSWVDRESRANAAPIREAPAPSKNSKRPRKSGPPSPIEGKNEGKENAAGKESSRSDRSLGILTKQFIRLLEEENGSLDLNLTAEKLKVQKRRIYDITNVLEGIGLIEKFKKNNIRWKDNRSNVNKSSVGCKAATPNNRQRKDELMQEKARLEQEYTRLLQMRAKVDGAIKNTLTNENTARHAYVTMDDIKKVSSLQDSLVLAISTPYETYMQVDDGCSDRSQPFTMNLEHKTQAGDVKLSSFVVPRCPGSPFQSSSESSDSATDYSSLDDYSSQDDDSCTDDSDLSSSSDEDSDVSTDYSSSDDDEDDEEPSNRMMIGKHTFESNLTQQDVANIYTAAMEEDDEESEHEYMSTSE